MGNNAEIRHFPCSLSMTGIESYLQQHKNSLREVK
jgi:hypothetical protein